MGCSCDWLMLLAGVAVCVLGFVAYSWFQTIEPLLTGEKKEVELIDKKSLTADTFRLRFALESQKQILGLPILKHLYIFAPNVEGVEQAKWNGNPDKSLDNGDLIIKRPYTPITGDETPGVVDFVIKVYRPNAEMNFPDGGKLSKFIDELKVGDKITVQGPAGKTEYLGGGDFLSGKIHLDQKKTNVNLIIGGSGITPALQFISQVFDSKNPVEKDMKISLIFANQSEEDIICRDLLERYLSEQHEDRFKLWYTVDRAPENTWKYNVGYVTTKMCEEHLFPPRANTITGICGPRPMSIAVRACLEGLGYNLKDIISF